MTAKTIEIVSIPVADQQRAKAFYVDKLGFTVEMERLNAFGPGKSWITLKPAGGGVMITLTTWFEHMPAGTLRGMVLGVDDADAEYERLRNSGVDIDPPKDESWGRFCTMRDSEGNGLILRAQHKT
jgi:catechol 2,3-dioxygenase-like lactoylglutathione lyase family enzyme